MSNRLTFSLASLTLILALAFVAMPAMAHDTDTEAVGEQHGGPTSGTDIPSPAETIGAHTHDTAPTVESIELVDIMAREADSTDTADPTSSTVRGSGVQLVTSVTADDPIRAAADCGGSVPREDHV